MKLQKKEIIKMSIVIFLGVMLTCFVAFNKNRGSNISYLTKKDPGEGNYEANLKVQIDESRKENEIIIDVPEVFYKDESIEKRLEEAESILEEKVLNGNESFEDVVSDLNFITKIPNTGIKVSWILDSYEVLDGTGHIVVKDPGEDGREVTLTAVLSYGDHERTWQKICCVRRNNISGDEAIALEIESEINEIISSESNSTTKIVDLPKIFQGHKIRWKMGRDNSVLYLLVGTIVLALLIPAKRIQEEKNSQEKRRKELQQVYPELVRRFQLYTNAGMSIRNAFQKIADDFVKEKGTDAQICIELQRLTREIGSGMSEAQCYESFGERCELRCYRKLAALASQNIRKGTKGMKVLLQKEADNAFEERKMIARRKGEEAGTKLLGPMFLMLSTVLVIIIIPAFLSIQI